MLEFGFILTVQLCFLFALTRSSTLLGIQAALVRHQIPKGETPLSLLLLLLYVEQMLNSESVYLKKSSIFYYGRDDNLIGSMCNSQFGQVDGLFFLSFRTEILILFHHSVI